RANVHERVLEERRGRRRARADDQPHDVGAREVHLSVETTPCRRPSGFAQAAVCAGTRAASTNARPTSRVPPSARMRTRELPETRRGARGAPRNSVVRTAHTPFASTFALSVCSQAKSPRPKWPYAAVFR